MFDKLNYIELSGEKYPLKCDILVLEKIQEEYGNLSKFENGIRGFIPNLDENGEIVINDEGLMVGTTGTPDIKMLNKALIWMIREGIEIAKDEGKEYPEFTDKALLRKVDITPRELGTVIHEEFIRCFARKNEKTTQREKAEKNQKE